MDGRFEVKIELLEAEYPAALLRGREADRFEAPEGEKRILGASQDLASCFGAERTKEPQGVLLPLELLKKPDPERQKALSCLLSYLAPYVPVRKAIQ